VKNPGKYYVNNTAGTISLLESMLKKNLKKMVFSSTCATFGEPRFIPIKEDHPQIPVNPYGASKLMIERILADYCAAYGLRAIILRYFNAAGADEACEIGEVHDPETHLIPLALQAALNKSKNITVYGADYNTIDGTCVRDYIHVSDLAEAHVLALKQLINGCRSDSYNLGNGVGYSVKQVLETVEKVTGNKINIIYGNRRSGDPDQLVADSGKAQRELCWSAKVPELESIVQTAYRWLLHQG
jgi:UDP-glucose-4-epimerase GalE